MADTALPPSDDPTEVQPNKWLIKDSKGYGSITLTLVVVSFVVTTLAYIAAVFQKVGPFQFRPFDPAASGAYFGLILGTYATRKWTEAKYNTNVQAGG